MDWPVYHTKSTKRSWSVGRTHSPGRFGSTVSSRETRARCPCECVVETTALYSFTAPPAEDSAEHINICIDQRRARSLSQQWDCVEYILNHHRRITISGSRCHCINECICIAIDLLATMSLLEHLDDFFAGPCIQTVPNHGNSSFNLPTCQLERPHQQASSFNMPFARETPQPQPQPQPPSPRYDTSGLLSLAFK